MKIEYPMKGNPKYYDMNGEEIHEGDTVLIRDRAREVYLTENGYLGTDATNPKWIETGRAVACEYGIYPFEETDEPVLLHVVKV